MKKYEKPQLYAESFELTEHIAACGTADAVVVNHGSILACSADIGNKVLFMTTTLDNACTGQALDPEIYSDDMINQMLQSQYGFCYNNQYNTMFTS